MAREPDEPDTMPGSVDDLTRGVDAMLGREVAMVTLPPAHGEALTVRTDQVRRLAALHHPSLLEVYDVDGLAEDTASTLVLQSVTGQSLDAVIDTARWPAVSVAHVGSQIADGLAHAHGHGVVHGGVGPASIVVDESLHAWLTGFTAALRPGAPTTPTSPTGQGRADDHTAPAPGDDVVALAAALRALLDPRARVPQALDDALAAMTAGEVDARAAADSLARAAEICAHGQAPGGVVPMAVHTARISTGRATAGAAAGPVSSPSSPSSARAGSTEPASPPAPVTSTAGAESPAVAPARLRSSWSAGRGLRVAALSGATMTLAVASGAVLWVTNAFSSPLPASAGAVDDRPVVAAPALDPAGPPVLPLAPEGTPVPGDVRPPLFDATTLRPTADQPVAEVGRERSTDDGAADSADTAPSDRPAPGPWSDPPRRPDPPRVPRPSHDVPAPAPTTTPDSTTSPPTSTTTPPTTTTTTSSSAPTTTSSTTTPSSSPTTSSTTSPTTGDAPKDAPATSPGATTPGAPSVTPSSATTDPAQVSPRIRAARR